MRPMSAYSRPVCGSVQPQMSFRLPQLFSLLPHTGGRPPIDSIGRKPSRSTSSHGKGPALPFTQGLSDSGVAGALGTVARLSILAPPL